MLTGCFFELCFKRTHFKDTVLSAEKQYMCSERNVSPCYNLKPKSPNELLTEARRAGAGSLTGDFSLHRRYLRHLSQVCQPGSPLKCERQKGENALLTGRDGEEIT